MSKNLIAACFTVLAALLCGCAATDRKLAPTVVYKSDDGARTQIILEQTDHTVQVFTPEGNRPAVQSSDFSYLLKEADGKPMSLPFISETNADPRGKVGDVFYSGEKTCWVGVNIIETSHAEHVTGLFEWKSVDDDFVEMRIKAFTRDGLISSRSLKVCNPRHVINNIVQIDATRPVLRYCGEEGMSRYFPLENVVRLESANLCCAATATSMRHEWPTRQRRDFIRQTTIVEKRP
jgi:hypothetical protein